MLTDEQREFRRTGIGGSDLGPLFGLTKRSALSVYLDKINETQPDDTNDDMTFGSEAEPFILKMYTRKFGHKVQPREEGALPIRHPDYPFMLASLDGMNEEGFVVEIKNVGRHGDQGTFNGRAWGEPGTCQIPRAYHLQVAHYCLITGAPSAHIVPYFGGSDLRLYVYHRNERLEKTILSMCSHFWNDHVLKKIPPLEGANHREMAQVWKDLDTDGASIADEDIANEVKKLWDIKNQKRCLEAQEDEISSRICAYMADKTLLNDFEGTLLATWSETERRSIDVKQLRKDEPLIAERFTAVKKTRTLRLKGEKQ